jgi:threonine synthase
MTTVTDDNISAVAVRGNFDDCQAMVKQAFADHPGLLAVNSINWARIAAQIGYYIYLATQMSSEFDVVVPTGNFGNALSCWTAKQMGVPIRNITLANNSNHALADAVNLQVGGEPLVVPTLAPAMDIAVPSNWERFSADPASEFSAGWADDIEIVSTMSAVWRSHEYLLDPHTATAWKVGESTRSERPQVVVATADPVKFPEAVRRALGREPSVPASHGHLLDLPERMTVIDATISDLEPLIR